MKTLKIFLTTLLILVSIPEKINENQTKVTWGFEGKMDYPMNTMLLLMDMEEMVGKDFSEGLQKLKSILENR